jgi:hypothetical protein
MYNRLVTGWLSLLGPHLRALFNGLRESLESIMNHPSYSSFGITVIISAYSELLLAMGEPLANMGIVTE